MFDSMDLPIYHMEKGFISALRERMREFGFSFWLEEVWKPSLQRKGDASIIEEFTRIKGITRAELIRANQARLYL